MQPESDKSENDAEYPYPYILKFIGKQLSKIIHHRNQLKNFRDTNNIFNHLYDAPLDIDFSKKFKAPLKCESQSMH